MNEDSRISTADSSPSTDLKNLQKTDRSFTLHIVDQDVGD